MIELKEMTLKSLLNKAKEKVNKTENIRYASYTKEISRYDLVNIFKRARSIKDDRTFWHSYVDDFTIVGIGKMTVISGDENSYDEINKQWRSCIDRSSIYNPSNQLGTGMITMGGLAFDYKKERTKLWENYSNYELIIPKLTFSQYAGKAFVTANFKVTEESVVEDEIAEMESLIDMLLNKQMDFTIKAREVKSKVEIEPDEWKETVGQARDEIIAEKAKKIVLAREMRLTFKERLIIGDVLEKLLETQPNSYVFAIEKGDDCFVGATPERLVKVEGNKLLSTCLAGTAPRGKTTEEDRVIAHNLLNDSKNREEHDYVVQMIKGSIASSCEAIHIPSEPIIYPLRNLQHLYTPVTAKIKKNYTLIDLVRKLHPTPALGGLPNDVAMEFIRKNEILDRGWYGAPVGWMDDRWNGEFAVAIRSGLIQSNEASLFAGCGVMKDSEPELEYEETNVKFLPMLNVLEEK